MALIVSVATFALGLLAWNWNSKYFFLRPLFFACLSLLVFVHGPMEFSTFGGVALFFALTWLFQAFVKWFDVDWLRQTSATIGIMLLFGVVFFASVGLRNLHEKELAESARTVFSLDFWRIESRVLYEATQAVFLNMDVHADGKTKDSDNEDSGNEDSENEEQTFSNTQDAAYEMWFALARLSAVLLAFFVAYQTITNFCIAAVSRYRIFFCRFKGTRPTCLVVGLGHVGTRIVKELIEDKNEKKCVIAVECNAENPNIAVARDLGAIVVESDALRSEWLRDVPLKAISEVFVVAGSDETNLRVAIELKKVVKQLKMQSIGGQENSLFNNLVRWLCKSEAFICHTRLDDPDLQLVLERAFANDSQTNKSNTVLAEKSWEFRVFNPNDITARRLVQFELTKEAVRPESHEVAMYTIVGFQEMGQAVASAIARLAHFDNFKRSRLLILAERGESRHSQLVNRYLVRYPRFTKKGTRPTELHDLRGAAFQQHLDDWGGESKKGSGELKFATQAQFSWMPPCPSDPEFIRKLQDLIFKSSTRVQPTVIVCLEEESQAFVWATLFEQAWRDQCYRNNIVGAEDSLYQNVYQTINIFVWLPYSNHLRQVISSDEGTTQEQTPQIVKLAPFGKAEEATSLESIRGELRLKLAEAVDNSYERARKSADNGPSKVEPPAPAELKRSTVPFPPDLQAMVRMLDQQSALYAGDHALIKYIVADGWVKNVTAARAKAAEKKLGVSTAPVGKFNFVYANKDDADKKDPEEMYDPNLQNAAQPQSSILDKLARAEHNRWSAEMLMRNYEYVKQEILLEYPDGLEKGYKPKRLPSHIHRRATLVDWDHASLTVAEKRKDWAQTYYVLYCLNQIATFADT